MSTSNTQSALMAEELKSLQEYQNWASETISYVRSGETDATKMAATLETFQQSLAHIAKMVQSLQAANSKHETRLKQSRAEKKKWKEQAEQKEQALCAKETALAAEREKLRATLASHGKELKSLTWGRRAQDQDQAKESSAQAQELAATKAKLVQLTTLVQQAQAAEQQRQSSQAALTAFLSS